MNKKELLNKQEEKVNEGMNKSLTNLRDLYMKYIYDVMNVLKASDALSDVEILKGDKSLIKKEKDIIYSLNMELIKEMTNQIKNEKGLDFINTDMVTDFIFQNHIEYDDVIDGNKIGFFELKEAIEEGIQLLVEKIFKEEVVKYYDETKMPVLYIDKEYSRINDIYKLDRSISFLLNDSKWLNEDEIKDSVISDLDIEDNRTLIFKRFKLKLYKTRSQFIIQDNDLLDLILKFI